MRILYNIAVFLYTSAIYIASLFNDKANLWVKGRKKIFENLRSAIKPGEKIFWFHASSLGEFEQGRPVMEEIKRTQPEVKILLSFFSPSGYEIRKNYEGADYIFYLPADTKKNSQKFLDIVKPEMVFFIKYEFWFNYIDCISRKNIPLFFFSVIFRKDQHFFRWYGSWFRKQLKKLNWIFVQDIASEELLKSINITNISICGDTRFDRVAEVAKNKKEFPLIKSFCGEDKIILAGSSWPADEDILTKFINDSGTGIKFIIAPHEIHKEHIESIMQKLKVQSVLYSELSHENLIDKKVLIIDCIGILLHLYQYSSFAYIGGGFGKSIHNILEAATFGKPVIFGPNFGKFREARDLIANGGAFCIKNEEDFKIISNKLLYDNSFSYVASSVCSAYVSENIGATKIITRKIFNNFHTHI